MSKYLSLSTLLFSLGTVTLWGLFSGPALGSPAPSIHPPTPLLFRTPHWWLVIQQQRPKLVLVAYLVLETGGVALQLITRLEKNSF